MKIAIYYPWVYLKSGCERSMVELLRRSRHEWTIFTNRYDVEATFPELKLMDVRELPRVPVRRSFLHVICAAARLFTQKLQLDEYQMLVVFCEGIGDLVVFCNHDLPLVCLCFTPLRAAFDEHYKTYYLRMHGNRWTRRLLLAVYAALFRSIDRLAWKHYDQVFAISDEVRSRIVRGRLCPGKSIEVIHPGIDLAHFEPSGRYDQRFLIAGRIMWTKNIELGIRAFVELLARRPDLSTFELVIAGFVDEKSRPYLTSLRELATSSSRIRFVESPSDEELASLYRDCYALVYTPFNEDWGLVPIEGMALEKPVISVNRGGPAEIIIHGETGFLVPCDVNAFSAVMEQLADDPELVRMMGRKAREHSRRFTWETFVRTLDSSLERLCQQRRVSKVIDL